MTSRGSMHLPRWSERCWRRAQRGSLASALGIRSLRTLSVESLGRDLAPIFWALRRSSLLTSSGSPKSALNLAISSKHTAMKLFVYHPRPKYAFQPLPITSHVITKRPHHSLSAVGPSQEFLRQHRVDGCPQHCRSICDCRMDASISSRAICRGVDRQSLTCRSQPTAMSRQGRRVSTGIFRFERRRGTHGRCEALHCEGLVIPYIPFPTALQNKKHQHDDDPIPWPKKSILPVQECQPNEKDDNSILNLSQPQREPANKHTQRGDCDRLVAFPSVSGAQPFSHRSVRSPQLKRKETT